MFNLPPRPRTPPGPRPTANVAPPSTHNYATVCSSNINRSMESHLHLSTLHLPVTSYGTGSQVRLPGKSAYEPKVFKFGTPYSKMYESLMSEDMSFFSANGIIPLCLRATSIKEAPERWQDAPDEQVRGHDVVVCFEERIFDACVEDLQSRQVGEEVRPFPPPSMEERSFLSHVVMSHNSAVKFNTSPVLPLVFDSYLPRVQLKPVFVVCLDTKDNPTESAKMGRRCARLCWEMEKVKDLEAGFGDLVEAFGREMEGVTDIKVLFQVIYL